MRRVTPWVLLAVVLVVAGCGSLTDSGTEAGTVTPVSVPPTETTPTPSTVAPGLAADRIVDATALVANHAAVLGNTSHTYRKRVTKRYPNGTVWRTDTTFVQRNGTALRYRYDWSAATGDGTRQVVDRWSTGGRTYVARTDGNGTTIAVENATTVGSAVVGTSDGYAASLDRLLQLLDVSVAGTEYRNGRRLYRLETPEPKKLSPSRNVTFVGYVTPEGVFTSYRLTYRIVRRGVRVDVTVNASFEGIGSTTVTRPSWADRIPNGTAG